MGEISAVVRALAGLKHAFPLGDIWVGVNLLGELVFEEAIAVRFEAGLQSLGKQCPSLLLLLQDSQT